MAVGHQYGRAETMADADKKLCKWKKADIEANFDKLAKLVKKPKHVCAKCARAAKSKKWLCKPERVQ
jgi:hypothetical protein